MRTTIFAAAALVCCAVSAQAATITPAAGLNLNRNVTENAAVQVFSEAAGTTVAAGDVTLDFLVGSNLAVGGSARGVSTFASGQALGAGTYDSFLVHFDPIGAGSVSNVTVDFGSKIVGLILSNSAGSTLLNLSDAFFGTAAAYHQGVGRRAENRDTFTLTNETSLTLNFGTNAVNIDNIRVLTEVAAVPLPASLPLLLAGLGGFGLMRRRNKKS